MVPLKVSVLVHNLNRADRLAACLDSVLAQEHRPLELVLLDAGSTDGSDDVVARRLAAFADAGIEVTARPTTPAGVAVSRNRAAALATGDLLLFLDNDATLADPHTVATAQARFAERPRLGALSLLVLDGDADTPDPATWVFHRRARTWSRTPFRTFTFTGGAFVIRSADFHQQGGFWEALVYSREEEDLALGLLDQGGEIWFEPGAAVRHYPGERTHLDLERRRYQELRNGSLVLLRRLPLPLAVALVAARTASMALRMRAADGDVPGLLRAVPEALSVWRRERYRRRPVGRRALAAYATAHVTLRRPWIAAQ